MASDAILFYIIGLLPLYYCFEDFQEFALKRINAYRDCHNAQFNISSPPIKLSEQVIEIAEFCALDHLRNDEVKPNSMPDKQEECIGWVEGGGRYVDDIVYLTNSDDKDPTKLVKSAIDEWYSVGCSMSRNTSKFLDLTYEDQLLIMRFIFLIDATTLELGIEALEKNTRVIVVASFMRPTASDFPTGPTGSCCSADQIDSKMGVGAAHYLLYLNPILIGVAITTNYFVYFP